MSDPFQEDIRAGEIKASRQAFQQMRQNTLATQAAIVNMQTLRAKWAAGVANGDYQQADVDKLDTLLAAGTTALPDGTTMVGALASFIATGVGTQ